MAVIIGDAGNNLSGWWSSSGYRSQGLPATIQIRGFEGDDLIYGNQGNDLIDDLGGAEGFGNDTIYGGQGNDNIGNTSSSGYRYHLRQFRL